MIPKKKPVKFVVGDTLLLVNTEGMPIKLAPSTVAAVVDGRRKFPRLFEEMIARVGYKSLENDFVCVDWPTEKHAIKGYYSCARFVKLIVGDQTLN